MDLKIIGPFNQKIYKIAWLELNTLTGNFVIQPGHAPMVLSLAPYKPITFCLTNGKQESLVIKEGFVEITRTSASIVVNEDL